MCSCSPSKNLSKTPLPEADVFFSGDPLGVLKVDSLPGEVATLLYVSSKTHSGTYPLLLDGFASINSHPLIPILFKSNSLIPFKSNSLIVDKVEVLEVVVCHTHTSIHHPASPRGNIWVTVTKSPFLTTMGKEVINGKY